MNNYQLFLLNQFKTYDYEKLYSKKICNLQFAICISLLTANCLLPTTNCSAQPSSLDTTFSSDGKVSTAIGSNNDGGRSVAVQTDGKIVVAGYSSNVTNYDFAVV